MEYRAWVTVPGITADSDPAEHLLDALSHRYGELGPVLSGTTDGLQVVMATDAIDEHDAARELYAATSDALRAAGLSDHYPITIEVEIVIPNERAIDPDRAERFVWRAGDVTVRPAKGKPPPPLPSAALGRLASE